MRNIIKSTEKYIIYLIILLIPSFALSIFPNLYSFPKLTLLVFGVALITLLKAIRLVLLGKTKIRTGQFDFIVVFLLLTYLSSTFFQSPSKMEALSLPGTASIIISSSLLYFYVGQLKKRKSIKLVLLSSGVLLSLIILLVTSGLFSKIPQLPAYLSNPLFNPMGGSSLPSAILLITLLPLGVSLILKEKDFAKRALLIVSSIILVSGLAISVSNILPGKVSTPVLLDFDTSWQIAAGAVKESPILGVGPGNYLTAFDQFRAISYNQTEFWANKFTSSRSYYLTIITETGLLGVAAITLLFVSLYRLIKEIDPKKLFNSASLLSLAILTVSFIFYPASISLIAIFFVLLALNNKRGEVNINLSSQENKLSFSSRLPALLISVPVIIGVSVFTYLGVKVVRAETSYKRALNALAVNDGLGVYELMRQTLSLNPSDVRYHITHSQVNLALARAISQEEEVSDQDRQTITQLIGQAIEEAKAAVALNPQRSLNWEVLARTYQLIIAFSEGADAFAIQTFSQAIALDPLNPNLRIALGGIHYALGDYDSAIDLFKIAVLAKPDLANARYNLAVAYREKGRIEDAIREMTLVLSLVDKESQDFELATGVLEDLEARRPSEETQGTSNLVPPPAPETSVIEPPIELPEKASPPEIPEVEEVEPTPTP